MTTATAPGAARFGEDLLITGEAVALEVRPASFLPRVVSALIDGLLYAMVVGTLAARLSYAVALNEAQFATLLVTSIVLVMVIIPTVVETLTRGRSLGKLAAGIRIVRDDGGPIRLRHAFVRSLTGVGELWLTAGGVAIICSLVTRRGKRVGDVLAGTYALRVRGAERRSLPLVMPPELAEWAATADIAALPDAVALTARRFLDRTGSMEPAARTALGRDLAARVEPFVSPPPPWGTNPERFLAAVLVSRRDREYALASRSQSAMANATAELRRLPHGTASPDVTPG